MSGYFYFSHVYLSQTWIHNWYRNEMKQKGKAKERWEVMEIWWFWSMEKEGGSHRRNRGEERKKWDTWKKKKEKWGVWILLDIYLLHYFIIIIIFFSNFFFLNETVRFILPSLRKFVLEFFNYYKPWFLITMETFQASLLRITQLFLPQTIAVIERYPNDILSV